MSVIDLSQLPPPTLVDVDYEGDLLARFARLKSKLAEIGVTWDADVLEPDTIVKLQEADAYWRKLDMQSINDMALARTLGFARGADLDWMAATFYVDLDLARMEGELDDRFERRILLAGEALSGALTEGGIVFHALTTSLDVLDAAALQIEPGVLRCVVLVKPGSDPSRVLDLIRMRFNRTKRRGTEEITFALAHYRDVSISVTLRHASGPSPELLRNEAVKMLESVKDRLEVKIGAVLRTDEIIAESRVGGVDKLILNSPTQDIDPGNQGVLRITDITVTPELIR